jgi:uncharacterized membrane protein YjgN (DUF898 family)
MKFTFTGTGGQLFGKSIVGMILTMITCEIYMPWYIVSMHKNLTSERTFGPTEQGEIQLDFTGSCGQFFVLMLVGMLLTTITLGIYLPWYAISMMKFYTDNTTATAKDGTIYEIKFEATGGEFFVTCFVGYLLTLITLFIYAPWFMCKLQVFINERTVITSGGQECGRLDFTGSGGDLFVTFLVGYLLTMVTFGIYGVWFQVNLYKFFATHTGVTIKDVRYVADFTGTGLDFLGLVLVGMLLCMVTFGIYGFWFAVKILKWQTDNLPVAAEGHAAAT